MADGRMLMKSIAYDERLAQLSVAAEYLFLKAIPHTDDEGRLLGLPAHIRGSVVPARASREGWTDDFIASLMREWTVTVNEYALPDPLVYWGEVRGIWVCEFNGFTKTQRLRRPGKSTLPAPPRESPNQESLFAAFRTAVDGHEPQVRSQPSANGREVSANTELLTERPRAGARGSEEKGSEEKVEVANATPAEVAELDDDVRVVYDHWRSERGKTHARYDTISDARRKKISTRLREFTVDDLQRAISAVALDPWDERPRHDDLTVILRSREQVERFLAFAETGPSPRPSRSGGLRPAEILALPEAVL